MASESGVKLARLREQMTLLQTHIADEEAKIRSEAIERIRVLMTEFGLTSAHINDASNQPSVPAKKKAKQLSPAKRTVVAKYRDPKTGATWTGRGLAPLWIRDKKREKFLIAH